MSRGDAPREENVINAVVKEREKERRRDQEARIMRASSLSLLRQWKTNYEVVGPHKLDLHGTPPTREDEERLRKNVRRMKNSAEESKLDSKLGRPEFHGKNNHDGICTSRCHKKQLHNIEKMTLYIIKYNWLMLKKNQSKNLI